MNFYIAATSVTILSIILFWLIFKRGDLKVSFKRIFLYGCISLPLSPAVNIIFKGPFFLLFYKIFGIKEMQEPVWFMLGIITPIGAALEEIIKILPLLIFTIKDEKRVIYFLGLILGLGFGISEAWYVAFSATQIETKYISGLQNLLMILSGFGVERSFAIFIHIFLTGIVAFGIIQRSFFKYLILATLLHSTINLPAVLFQMKLLSDAVTSIILFPSFCILVFVFFKITKKIREPKEEIISYEKK